MNPNRATNHLADERTFLAWLGTGIAVAVFGFAIGRFAVAMRELTGFDVDRAGAVRGLRWGPSPMRRVTGTASP